MNTELSKKTCKPCEGGVLPLKQEKIEQMLKTLRGWEQSGKEIARTYVFQNYYETMAFVNATAWISHREDHHPDIEIGYNRCRVRYSTHAIDGLSENDFICATKIDSLFEI
ncbi:MAG: 4a-hydroxytetrahydrobiopterin dehydratase [Gammaproteobacteria bacterium]|nr:4a-hydroxytetrahydrobiopterin dehydratase [Gammaproteobacteria bacterium]MBU1731503.1 4a-hydroxytetrahydrobiopterin dehydratase [Gammaproteobacteria bacterium]MBU1893008.1 4a-hydroxytetrahydrobiopterin dehydratase [Gammaproteobacteria bacterium]